ncbi:MAG: TolC family protein [Gammaproteobacteria bacterium]|nr:MAG: TolC family protein [Gammaproteobacteria bacterium]
MRVFSVRPFAGRAGILGLIAVLSFLTLAVAAEPRHNTAQGDDPAGVLTLEAAVAATLARNPDLAASSFTLKAAAARIMQAQLRPNPELSVEIENFAGSGVLQGIDGLESTLSLSQVVELGGKRRLRSDLALMDRDLLGVERQAQELDVLVEVTRRFIALVAAQDRVALAAMTSAIAQRTLEAVAIRVQAARSPEAELSRASIALTRARVEVQQAESAMRAARQVLAALWGSQHPGFTEASGDLLTLRPVKPLEALLAALEGNPDYLRFASEARLRDAELRLARAQARPNIVFGLGMRRLEEGKDLALVVGFSMPLPLSDRNQGGIREAEMLRAQTDAQRQAALTRARATVFALYQELIATGARVETLRSGALAEAQQALEQTQYGYDRGRFSYLELATAQQELLDLRAAIIDAAADYHRLLAEIERLTNETLGLELP